MPTTKILDARGYKCPVPTLKVRKLMAELTEYTVILVLADDPMAQIDIPHFCQSRKYELRSMVQKQDYWVFEIAFRVGAF